MWVLTQTTNMGAALKSRRQGPEVFILPNSLKDWKSPNMGTVGLWHSMKCFFFFLIKLIIYFLEYMDKGQIQDSQFCGHTKFSHFPQTLGYVAWKVYVQSTSTELEDGSAVKRTCCPSKGPSFLPSTHTMSHYWLWLHFQGMWNPLLTSIVTRHTWGIPEDNIFIHMK